MLCFTNGTVILADSLLQSGSGTLTLRLTKKAKAALRSIARVTLSLRTELRAGGPAEVKKSPISVRR